MGISGEVIKFLNEGNERAKEANERGQSEKEKN